MPITSQNPVTIPAAVYDQWYITSIMILSPPNQTWSASVTFHRARTLDDGSTDLCPVAGDRTLTIADLGALAAADTNIASLIGTLPPLAAQLALASGVID